MESCAIIIKDFSPLTIVANFSIIDISEGRGYNFPEGIANQIALLFDWAKSIRENFLCLFCLKYLIFLPKLLPISLI